MLGRPGFFWRTQETKQLLLHYESNSYAEKQLELLAANEEAAVPQILDLIGDRTLRRKVHVFVVENTDRMKALTGYDYRGLALPTENSACFVFGETFNGASAHELTHVVSQNIWGLLAWPSQTWLNEGFACFADSQFLGGRAWDLHAAARRFRDAGCLVPLQQLQTNFPAISTDISYLESGSFVKFLYDCYGREKLKLLWQRKGDLSQIYRKSLGELETEWHQSFDRAKSEFDRAESQIHLGMTKKDVLAVMGTPLRESKQVAEWNSQETEEVAEWHSAVVKARRLSTSTEWRVLYVYFDMEGRVRITRAHEEQK